MRTRASALPLNGLRLQLWCGRFDRCLLAADDAMDFRWALIDRVSAGDEELAEVFATEADILGRLRRGDDEVHPACLIADLDAERGGDVETALGVNAETANFKSFKCDI